MVTRAKKCHFQLLQNQRMTDKAPLLAQDSTTGVCLAQGRAESHLRIRLLSKMLNRC